MPTETKATDYPHLVFNFDEVAALVDHARAARKRMAGAPRDADLALVGDSGVYLMSLGQPGVKRDDGKGARVAYAAGCNPDVDPFDDWWGLKGSTFGPDDGVEYIGLGALIDRARQCPASAREIVIGFKDGEMVIDITSTVLPAE